MPLTSGDIINNHMLEPGIVIRFISLYIYQEQMRSTNSEGWETCRVLACFRLPRTARVPHNAPDSCRLIGFAYSKCPQVAVLLKVNALLGFIFIAYPNDQPKA
jgi:hypothetical protein